MNPLKFKSLCINKNTHDLITSLAEEILPYGRMTRSQVVNLAVNRLKQQMYKGELSVGTFNKPKNLNNLIKIKLFYGVKACLLRKLLLMRKQLPTRWSVVFLSV